MGSSPPRSSEMAAKMQTVQEQIAHERNLQTVYKDLLETEEEVNFLGKDAYVPRLVTATLPKLKKTPVGVAPGQDSAPARTSYAEPLPSNRPLFKRSTAAGAPEPQVFPKGTIAGLKPVSEA